MAPILSSKSFLQSAILTILYFGTGLLFLNIGWDDLGWWFFIVLPLLLGIAIGFMERIDYGIIGTIAGSLLVLGLLFVLGGAAVMCIVSFLPIQAIGISLGLLISWLIRRYVKIRNKQRLPAYVLPLVLYLFSAPIVQFMTRDNEMIVEVRTDQIFNYPAEHVFDAIKSVDTLIAEKPLLMKFDLPIPVKCVLGKEEVGGIRTCYFEPGRLTNSDFGSATITERITEIHRPSSVTPDSGILNMDVIDYNIQGREWLGFKEAIYYFKPVDNDKCKLTRITTYTSSLNPRIYWEPIEKWSIQQEHEYVFRNLENDLRRMLR